MPSSDVSPSPQSEPLAACRRAALRSIASHPAAGAGHGPQRPAPSRKPHGLLRLSRKLGSWLCCCLVLVLLAAGLTVLSAAPGLAADPEDEDGDLRLTRGGDKGRLLVYYNGRWGGVCDDGFGWEEADVACRQLEYPGADRYDSRTDWSLSLPIWLDDVVCVGTEERLADCSHTAWGGHNCSPQEHVWVQCTVTTADASVLAHPKSFAMDDDSTATYEVWLDTAPTSSVTIPITVAENSGTDVTVQPESLTFTTENWNSRQTVTVSAAADIDIDVGDDVVTLEHSASGGGYDSVTIDVRVTVDDPDVVRVVVDPRVVTVDEGDATGGSYAVVLSGGQPTGDVKVTVAGNDDTDVSVQPATLTFGTTDWNMPQTVTVTAAEDDDKDSDTVILTHEASGGGYNGVSMAAVSVRVRDNDIPGVAVDRQVVTIDEGDSTGDTYAVVLTGRPSGSVTITVAGHSGTDVSVQPATLTFGTMDWITPQTVTVTAAADSDKASDTVTLTHSASGGGYDALAIPAVDVRVQDKDIEVAASPAALTVEENGTATYALQPVGGPWDSLTVAVEPEAGSGFKVSPSTVTFARADWNTPKTIRVAGQRDDDWSDDTWEVAHSAQEGSGPGTVPAQSVAVTVDDLGSPGALIDDGGIVTLDEGSSATYSIRLMRNPGGTATVTIEAPSRLNVIRPSISPPSLSFDSSNWSQSREVTIEALQDSDSADDTVRVRHRIAQDGLEASLRSTQVRITDDDDGESLIGTRPEAANVWWAALTASVENGGVVGHIDYREPFPDTGKLSDDAFTYDGIGREIDAVYLDRTGHFQIWVDSGNGSALPNDLVLHVGSASMTLGSATQSFGTTYTEGMTPMVREHTYWWQAGSHSVAFSNRQAVAVWLEEPDGTRSVPGTPQDVQGTPGDGKVKLQWEPPSPPGNGTRSVQQVLHYEYQQEGTEGWTDTDGPETTEEVPDLVNGESYRFRVRAVSAEGKGAASAPSAPVTPAEAQGLTGEFVSVPASHDGSSPFTLQIEFSDEIAQRFRRKRNDVFEVTGGTVQDLRRVDRRRDLWDLTVAPSSVAAVEIVVPAERACDVAGAVCTAAGDRLSEVVEATVPGPPTVSIRAGTSPVTEGEAATFTLERTGDTAAALTVTLNVTEDGAVLSGTPATEAVFAAGAATAELSVATEDDEVSGDGSVVTVSLAAGTGYAVDANAAAAAVTVKGDNNTPTNGPLEIAGTPETWTDVTVSTEAVEDPDGNTRAESGQPGYAYEYQWLRWYKKFADGEWHVTKIQRATQSTYRLRGEDRYKRVQVRVRFVDDAGNAEKVMSEVFPQEGIIIEGNAWEPLDQVTGVAVTPGDGALEVSWTQVSGALGYLVRWKSDADEEGFEDESGKLAAIVSPGTQTSHTVTGLSNGVEYTLVVEALTRPHEDSPPAQALDGPASDEVKATPRPEVTVEDRAATEGSGVEFAVGLSAASAVTVTVDYATSVESGDTASTADYTETTGTLTIAAGETSATITVATAQDTTDESDETFTLTLSNPVNAALGHKSAATGTIADDDAALPTVSIAAGASSVTEGTAASFTLTRTGDTAAALTVALSVTEEGAVLSGTPATEAEFAAGAASAELSVATEDDSTAEADGRVTITLSAGSGYGVDADAGTASVDVYDNDQATAAEAAADTLWSSTLEWTDMGGGWLIAYSQDFSSARWSEDGHAFSIWYIAYDSASGALWLQLTSEMPAGGIPEPAELTMQVGEATVGPGDAMAAFAAGGTGIASVVAQSWSAGENVTVLLTRAVEAEGSAASGPGISVADAEVREAEGAVLSFPVTLDLAQASAVSVRYATSDGTAVAGADYETTSGALRFEAGETAKTVAVPVLNDAHNEGSETLTLTLSDPFGATLADGEATGTIVNTGAIPQAWITRFGRTVAQQAVDAIGERLGGASSTPVAQVTIGGVELVGSDAYAEPTPDGEQTWPIASLDLGASDLAGNGRGLTGRELLLGSSFRLGAGGEEGGPSWSAWGQFATSGFEGEESGLSLSGDVTTGFVGADLSLEHWLAGVALGASEGAGSFDDGTGGGTLESSLTGVYPYARLDMGDSVDIWGLIGMGSGDLTLRVGEEVTETDLSMQMGAVGLRGVLLPAEEAGDFDLALKTDALWVRTESDAAQSSTGGNLEAARGTASRLRVALEGSQSLAMGAGATLTPTLALGLRHDGGDAESGTGVEAGLGLQYADPAQGLAVEGRVRGLLTHTDDGYEEWGASGSIRLDPGLSGRGVSLSVTPVWGAASGGVDRLWATRPAAGLLADDGFASQARLHAELGYGMRPPLGHGVLTPYAGLSLTGEGAGRTYHLGARWRGASAFHMALEASHGEDAGTGEPLDAASLRASVRW